MKLIEYLSNSEQRDTALIIYSLLNRIPVIITGEEEELIEEIINDVVSLTSFRNPLIFYTDFVNVEDYNALIENENVDFEIQRNLFVCYPFALNKLIDSIKNFKSWIIGCPLKKNSAGLLIKIKEILNTHNNEYLRINIEGNLFKSFLMVKNKNNNPNLTFEKQLFNNAIKKTEFSIEKMKRVVKKRIKRVKVDDIIIRDLFDFSVEEQELKENILKKDIKNFYDAARRAFRLLNRLNNLKEVNFDPSISPNTLFLAIDYEECSEDRFLEFIKAEWEIKFNNFFETKKISKYMDKMESLWG